MKQRSRSGHTFRRCSVAGCVCLLAACASLGLAFPVQASDQLLIGVGNSSAGANGAETGTKEDGSSLSDTSLGSAGYNGGPTMLGSGSTLTV